MPTNELTKISGSPDAKPEQSTEQIIREWLVKLAEIHRKNGAPYPLTAVMVAVWVDSLGDLEAGVLDAAFRKVAQVGCRREFPTPADVRAHIDRTKETALAEAAAQEWQRVLALRRQYWSPDAPGGFWPGMPELSERVQAACRASGVFRDFTSAEFEKGELHTWAKKRFVESYLAWEVLGQDQFLLPDGEIKRLLAGFAQPKALPAPAADWNELHADGLAYAEECKVLGVWEKTAKELPDFDPETKRQLEEELAAYGQRFNAALEHRTANP